MEEIYDPKKIIEKKMRLEYPNYDEDKDFPDPVDENVVLNKNDDGIFKTKGCKTISCKECGNNQFYISDENWITILKCKNCEYELPIRY